MDPTTCYLDLIAASNRGDIAEARELALALRDWLDDGGYYPPGHAEEEVTAYLNGVLRRTACVARQRRSSLTDKPLSVHTQSKES
jgi:hypothetical protein